MTNERLVRIREFADSDSSKRGDVVRDLLAHIEMLEKKEHEPGCPAIADDESDEVLTDYQQCTCTRRGDTIRDLLAHDGRTAQLEIALQMERTRAEKMRTTLVKYADKKNWGHRYSQSYTDEPFDWWLEEGPGYALARQTLEEKV